MALTDDQITAKNFRDFYDTIFPYLSGAVHAGFTPVGTIINVIGTTAPANYLKCDGATYSITAYLPLATYIKNQFGSYNHFGGDGVTTFAVPTKAGGTDDIYCIAIRDLNVDLYVNYSENEQIIGHWINGKPVYQKTIEFGAGPNATEKNVPHGISNLGKVINAYGTANNGTMTNNIPYVETGSSVRWNCTLAINATNITLTSEANWSAYNIYMTLQYTKTTD